jgi:hypothetical protein
MGDCAIGKTRFETTPLALEAAFDGGRITSDGGLIWLAETDNELGVREEIASHTPRVEEGSLGQAFACEGLLRQRVFQIACGYEDQNDSDMLRREIRC